MPNGNIGNWNEVKAQAATVLGIELVDGDIDDVPLLATDPYGHFIPGASGFPQMVVGNGTDGLPGTNDDVLVEGNPDAPISTATAVSSNHEFLNDIAHHAAPGPIALQECPPNTPAGNKAPDADAVAGPDDHLCTTYDDELLGRALHHW